jgi:glycerol-3-phosphate dehydrogenase
LIVSRKDLNGALLLLHPADGRVFFVIPWMEKTLVGTTDTITDESPDSLSVTPAEIDYLLEGYNRYFTTTLQSSDVLGTFAGLRPLMRSGRGKPSSLSREYRIVQSPSGLISVAGGKYTTYRRMAEVITDTIARRLGRRGPCGTRDCALDGALPVAQASGVQASGVSYDPGSSGIIREVEALRRSNNSFDEESARHLVMRYGSRARDVAAYCLSDPKGLTRIVPDAPDLRGEPAYQRDQEMTIYPADFALRRTRLGLFHPEIIGTVI